MSCNPTFAKWWLFNCICEHLPSDSHAAHETLFKLRSVSLHQHFQRTRGWDHLISHRHNTSMDETTWRGQWSSCRSAVALGSCTYRVDKLPVPEEDDVLWKHSVKTETWCWPFCKLLSMNRRSKNPGQNHAFGHPVTWFAEAINQLLIGLTTWLHHPPSASYQLTCAGRSPGAPYTKNSKIFLSLS